MPELPIAWQTYFFVFFPAGPVPGKSLYGSIQSLIEDRYYRPVSSVEHE